MQTLISIKTVAYETRKILNKPLIKFAETNKVYSEKGNNEQQNVWHCACWNRLLEKKCFGAINNISFYNTISEGRKIHSEIYMFWDDVIYANNDFIFNFERNADDESLECQPFNSFQIKILNVK